MTDLAKAIAFATQCLKWTDVSAKSEVFVCDGMNDAAFNIDIAADLEAVLAEFLGKRYFIQINRGTSSLFHWRVIVGLQDLSIKGAHFDSAQAEGEELWDVIFDACVQATHLDKK